MSLQAIYNKQFENIDKQIGLFNTELEVVTSRIKTLALSKLKGLNEADIINYDVVWNEILQQSGYFDLVNKYISKSFDSIYDDILKGFEVVGLDVVFTERDITKINALKLINKQFFEQIGQDAGLEVKKSLYGYVIGGLSEDQIAINLANNLDEMGLSKYANTYANTAITNFNQSVIDMKTTDQDAVWIYDGVDDAKTRDFCKCLLDSMNYYDTNTKIELQNRPERAWNCRHQFYSVSKEWAEEQGYIEGYPSC